MGGFMSNDWQICLDNSGESERFNEGAWFICNKRGDVLGDASFNTKQQAIDYLKQYEGELCI